MRIYKITADCLVDFCLLTWFVVAKNERDAWLQGYNKPERVAITR